MDTVSISTQYQVVIPPAARKHLRVKPGQKMQVVVYDDRIVLVPVRPMKKARGSLKGLNTDVLRDDADRV